MPLTHNDSPGTYAAAIEKFFLVTLRCLNGHESGYKIPLTTMQKEAASLLFQSLLSPENDALNCLHRFSWTLLGPQPDTAEVTNWSCPLLCYFSAFALQKDGNFMSPDEYSGLGAKFKYFCHNTAIVEADLRSLSHPQGMIGLVSSFFSSFFGNTPII
jgi:hypothetical protein